MEKIKGELLCDNAIIDALKDYNSTQLKIFYGIIYVYKIQVEIEKTIEISETLEISFEKMKQIIGGKKNLTYREISEMVVEMPNKIYFYENGIKSYISIFHGIQCEPYEECFYIKFSEESIPYLFNFVEKFTSICFKEFQKLSKKYSQRLYELYSRRKNQSVHTMHIEDFKQYFKVPEGYRQSEINKFILKPSIEEIKDKLKIEIRYKKRKKATKVTHIEFYF